MKKIKLNTAKNQIKQGKMECLTDIKIGYVEIRTSSGKRQIIQVTQKTKRHDNKNS